MFSRHFRNASRSAFQSTRSQLKRSQRLSWSPIVSINTPNTLNGVHCWRGMSCASGIPAGAISHMLHEMDSEEVSSITPPSLEGNAAVHAVALLGSHGLVLRI
mmetsp:Transcript_2348/g.8777  ORF Transcript_2348/g.8777 Transcript_2348/m.8777 type:complete len:103 (+) Transcript_2348:1004-1312(+)